MEQNIDKVITSMQRCFQVDEFPVQWDAGKITYAKVTEITYAIGDPTTNSRDCYIAHLNNGQQVEIYNFAEVWYKPA